MLFFNATNDSVVTIIGFTALLFDLICFRRREDDEQMESLSVIETSLIEAAVFGERTSNWFGDSKLDSAVFLLFLVVRVEAGADGMMKPSAVFE